MTTHPPVHITISTSLSGTADRNLLGHVLISIVYNDLGIEDDAGLDWYTEAQHRTYIGNSPDWVASVNRGHAALVDAGNYLIYGKILTLTNNP